MIKKKYLIIIVIIVTLILGYFFDGLDFIMESWKKIVNLKENNLLIDEKLDLRIFNIDLSNINKVMIVAHPDDEMLWGGAHLLQDDYLVVCITCGERSDRVKEFKNVMKETNDKYIMLDYPDYPNFKKDDWKTVYNDIVKDIDRILKMKDWKVIVTHNEQGEYGHIHHKMTHQIVTNIYKRKYLDNNSLYFFGEYYKKNKISEVEENLQQIDKGVYNKKYNIIFRLYKTQTRACRKHEHMIQYENWEKYIVEEE